MKRTWQPKKYPRVRSLGFLARKKKAKKGINPVVAGRRSKKRKKLSVSDEFGRGPEKNKRFGRRRK